MNKEQQKYLYKFVLVILAFITVNFCLLLYLGYDYMREKIFNGVQIFLVIGGLIAVLVGIAWICFPKKEAYCVEHNGLFISYKKGILVIGKENIKNNISYYDDYKTAFSNIEDNDTVYLFNSDGTLGNDELSILADKQNVTIKLMKTNAEIKINKSNDTKNEEEVKNGD